MSQRRSVLGTSVVLAAVIAPLAWFIPDVGFGKWGLRCFQWSAAPPCFCSVLRRRRRPPPEGSPIRCRATAFDALIAKARAVTSGSAVDTGYEQEQFLGTNLKAFYPKKKKHLKVVELCPPNSKLVAYFKPDKDTGCRLDRYAVMTIGPIFENVKESLESAAEKALASFTAHDIKNKTTIPPTDIDIGVLAPGTSGRIQKHLEPALKRVRKTLASRGGVVLLLATKEDEAIYGGDFETIIEAQAWRNSLDTEDIPQEEAMAKAGKLLDDVGLLLVRVIRDECGTSIGICVKKKRKRPDAETAST